MRLARLGLSVLLLGTLATTAGLRAQSSTTVQLYKESTCGCCAKWADHMRANGFTVNAVDVANRDEYLQKYKVPEAAQSCHLAVIDGYAIVGHVPAEYVKQFLARKPKVLGLAVAGMPPGSPGMESDSPQPFDVVTFDANGKVEVFAKHVPRP